MPRLILLNGLPGCGKSTLAQRYADTNPLVLNLDIDRVRDMLGQWRSAPGEAGLRARAIALAAARVHLSAGHDVVIPQFLGRLTFIEQAEQAAREAGAGFTEVVLLDDAAPADWANSLRRGAGRASAGELREMCERLTAVLRARPATWVVRSHAGEIDRTFRELVAVLSARRGVYGF